jgi:hypothetical protein
MLSSVTTEKNSIDTNFSAEFYLKAFDFEIVTSVTILNTQNRHPTLKTNRKKYRTPIQNQTRSSRTKPWQFNPSVLHKSFVTQKVAAEKIDFNFFLKVYFLYISVSYF